MNNESKLNKKILDIKLEIEDLVKKINEEKNDDNTSLNFSADNQKLIKEENSVINSSLDFLDHENEKLFLKIEKLKNEVQNSLEKLASENTFMDIIEKFIKIYGVDNIDKNELNKFFNIENKYVQESKFFSNEHVAIKNNEKFHPVNDLISEAQKVFETEINHINEMNSDKESFIEASISSNNLSDEQKLFELFSKIDNLKDAYVKKINNIFEKFPKNENVDDIKQLHENLVSVVVDSYDEFKKNLTKTISWNTFLNELPQNPSILENAKNYQDDSYENLDQKISDIQTKIKLQKNKYDLNDFGLDSFNSYLLFNKVDDSSLQTSLDSMYLDCIENFVDNLKFKKDEIDRTITDYQKLISTIANKLMDNIKNANNDNAHDTLATDTQLANNNFFKQKSLELVDKIKSVFEEVLNFQKSAFTEILSVVSFDSLKKEKENFVGLINTIKDFKNEYETNVEKLSKSIQDDLNKILAIETYNLDSLKKDISFDINECLKQLYESINEFEEPILSLTKLEKEYKIHKLDKLENVLKIILAYKTNNEPKEFEFEKNHDYIGVRLDKLEKQFTKFVNILDPLNRKIMETNTSAYDEKLKGLEDKISSKIDQLIQNIANERETIEKRNDYAIEQILESNRNQKQSILDLIQEIEEEKMNLISDQSTQNMIQNNIKLTELEDLIALQSTEIENLLNEKNEFVKEIENVLENKKEKLTNENIDELKQSINQVMSNFNEKIEDLEYNFDRKISMIDLSSLDMTINENQKEFFDSIESKLTNNYELVKQEFKTDMVDILNNINQLKDNYENKPLNANLDHKFDEITGQFDQFSFILKNISEKLISQDANKSAELNEIVNNLNIRFETLINGLKQENIKSNALLSKKVHKTSKNFTSKIMSNINEINERFNMFLDEAKKDKQAFENTHESTINAIIETNNANKKEILDRISLLEQENLSLLNEIEVQKVMFENNKLRGLEDLITIQNDEIESLLNEKNEFVEELQSLIKNKQDDLSNENIEELKYSVNNLMAKIDDRIATLEYNFDKKINTINLSENGDELSVTQQQFFDSLESKLSQNYELVKNEFKTDLIDILNNINELKGNYQELKLARETDGLDELKDQFDQFSFILKNISEKLVAQDENKSNEINEIVENLNSRFESLIQGMKEENSKSNALLSKKVNKTSKKLSSKIEANFNEINDKFNLFVEEIRKENQNNEYNQVNVINTIIETNNANKKEILDRISLLEQENLSLLNEIEVQKVMFENNKLRGLEDLIAIQNDEMESLLNEKNEFIDEIYSLLKNKQQDLNDESLDQITKSVNDVMARMEDKINALEFNFDKKLNAIHLNEKDDQYSINQKEFFDSLEYKLAHNYELVKNEFKTDLFDILNNINELKQNYQSLKDIKENDGLQEVRDQFDQFSFILKNISEKLVAQDENKSNELNEIVENLNSRFEGLINGLKKENNKANALLSKKVYKTSKKLSTKIDTNFNEINEKFNAFIDEAKKDKQAFENNQENAINAIIATNNFNKQEILDRISLLEQENLSLLNEIEVQKVMFENNKLRGLEELITVQNDEIESLLNEKNEFIDEIQTMLKNKQQDLTDENFEELKRSVTQIMGKMEDKIDALEFNFDRKLNNIHLNEKDDQYSINQKEFFDSLEYKLAHNYELVKNEFKTDLIDILNNINELKEKYETLKVNNESNELNDIRDQFDQFSFILKNISEKLVAQDENKSVEIENIVNALNNKFENVIEGLKEENNKANALITKKVSKTSKRLAKMMSNFDEINEKFNTFIDEAKKDKQAFENNQENAINAIIATNNFNKQEILDRISLLEQENLSLLNEIEVQKVMFENNKLRGLEDLITVQNDEIESLLNEKNEFIDEIQTMLKNKQQDLTDENFEELKRSVTQIMGKMEDKIDALEFNFDRKLNNIHLNEKDDQYSINQKEFFDSLEYKLAHNYELVKNEFKTDLIDILNNINELKENYQDFKNNSDNEGLDDIRNQFEQFSFILKNISETMIEKDNQKANEVNEIMQMLNTKFENLISNIKAENKKTSNKIINKVLKSNKSLSKKMTKDFESMNQRFVDFMTDIKNEQQSIVQTSIDSIKNIVETNKINKQEIFDIIFHLESKNLDLLTELELKRFDEENLRLKELEVLIENQNDEICGLIEQKNEIIDEIEKIILENKDCLSSSDKNNEMQEALENIIIKFDNKINTLEQNLYKKIDEIGAFSQQNLRDYGYDIERIENNLLENYGFIKEDLRSIFLDLSHKFEDIVKYQNDDQNNALTNRVDLLLQEVKDIKEVGNTMLYEIKQNSNALANMEIVLDNRLSQFIDEQKQTFNNIEKILETCSPDYMSDERANELDKWFTTMKELLDSHSDFVEYLNNKVEDIENAIQKIDTNDFKQLAKVIDNMDEKLSRNEEMLNSLNETALLSFNEIKSTILQKLENKYETSLSQEEEQQLFALTNKLNELEDLMLLQEEQTSLLISEKDELLKKFEEINLSKKAVSTEELNQIAFDAYSLDQKLESLYDSVSDQIHEIINLSKNKDDSKEMNNVVSNIILETNENINLLTKKPFDDSINMDDVKLKLDELTNKLNDINKEIIDIQDAKIADENFKDCNDKLDNLRNSLLCCDFDLLAIKESAINNSIDNSQKNKFNLELNELNKQKINLVENLIKHNKQYLNNILNQKNELVDLLIDNQKDSNAKYLETKASHYVDLLTEKIFEKQNSEYKTLNQKIDELRVKFDLFLKPNSKIANINIFEEIAKLEKEIEKLFEIIERKKKEIVDVLAQNISNDNAQQKDELQSIIEKFETNKDSIKKEYEKELQDFKTSLLEIKSKELNSYKNEIKDIEEEINNLKINANDDTSKIKDFEPLDNLVEELNFEINSFEQEKENLYKQIKEKIDFLNSLEKPSEDDLGSSINTDKFKSSLNIEAKQIIEQEFNSFEKEFEKNLKLVKKGLNDIKKVYEQEIDSPTWFQTFNEKLESIEKSLIGQKIEKDKNLNETTNIELELINNSDVDEINNEEVISFVNEQENKKKEIELFYEKLRDLEGFWKK